MSERKKGKAVRTQDNYTCKSPHGFGVLDAALIAKTASHFESAVTLEINGRKCNAKSLLEVLSLSIEDGDSICVTAEGEDAAEAVRNIGALLCCGRKPRAALPQFQPAM